MAVVHPGPRALMQKEQRAVSRPSSRPQLVMAVAVVCLGVAASLAVLMTMRSWERERMALDFSRAANDRISAMARNLEVHDQLAASLNSLFRTDAEISRTDFRKYTSPLLEGEACLQALAWIPRVQKADRAAYEEAAARETGREFHFTERTPTGETLLRPECQEYYPVYYDEPYENNLPAMGFDVASSPERRRALEAARDTGQAVAAGPVSLVQTDGQDMIGYVIYRPVYDKGLVPETVEARRALLKGYTFAVFRAATSLMDAVRGLDPAGMDMYVVDNTTPGKSEFVCFVPSRQRAEPLTLASYLKSDPPMGLRQAGDLKLTGGKTWTMICTPTPAFVAAHMTWQPWGGLGAVLLFTLTLTFYLLNAARHAARTERLMDSLRNNENKYKALYDNVSVGVSLISPNMEVLDLNRRMREWFPQIDPEQHPTCFRAFNSPPRNDCCTYCPTRLTLQDGQVHEAVSETPTTGGIRHYRIVSSPLTDADGKIVAAIEMVDDITEHKRAQEMLTFKTLLLEAQVESSPDGILVVDNHDQRILNNRRLIDIWNIPPHIVATKYDRAQLQHVASQVKDPALFLEKVQYLNAHPEETSRDEVELKDGRVLDRHSSPLRGADGRNYGRIWTFRDITDRKRLEQELRRLAVIAEQAPLGISMADMDGNLLFVNEAWARIHGYESSAELAGKHLSVFHTEEQLKTEVIPFNETVKRLGRYGNEMGHMRKDGTTFPAQMAVVILRDEKGEPCGLAAFAEDITHRKRTEAAIRQAKTEAEQANAAKSRFLANMSHEIRTPMTAILGFTDLLGQSMDECADVGCPAGHDPASRREYLKTIQRNGEHLLGLINDILDISKIEAGKMQLERTTCSPVQIVEEVVSLIRVPAIGKGLTLDGRYAFPLPEAILSDPVRVRQVLVNLVGNAVKFTAHGGIEVRVRFEPATEASRPLLAFEVRDTGIGMTPEQAARLFQPFSQADSSTTRQFGGTGLGLSISKRLAEALGGDIHVESAPGKGSTFTFTLEAELPASVGMLNDLSEAARTPHPAASAPSAGVTLHGTLLLAEDGPDNQALISAILRKAGARVDVASNGRVALDKALAAMAAGTPYDAILMDMQMPEMDGYEATSQLRRAGHRGPVIALTAHAMPEDRRKCLEAGCDDYATKPIDRLGLLRTLARLIGGPTPAPSGTPADPAPGTTADAGAILSTFRDDPDMVDILGEFVGHLPLRMAEMRQAAGAGAWDALGRLAHQMKGAGGSYGYAGLTEAARDLESHVKQGDVERAMMAMNHLAQLCERVQAGLAPLAKEAQ
jgi:PAS domain S-box-containing protein